MRRIVNLRQLRSTLFVGLAFAMVLMAALPATANGPTIIAVYGPQDWRPDPGYEVHALGRTRTIDAENGGGRWSVEVTAPFEVTVLRLHDCQPILRFTAEPGRTHAIQFEADGSVSWSVISGSDGGRLPPTPARCSLPDTGTVPGTRAGSEPLPAGLTLTLAAALGVLLARRRLQHGAAR